MIYFKTYARENGCPDEILNSRSDLKIWNWIQDFQATITIWEYLVVKKLEDGTEEKHWIHNHLEDGYNAKATTPTPKFPNQKKAWAGKTWKGIEGRLFDNIVTVK